MSLRAAMVDYLAADAGISAIVGARVFDRFLSLQDLGNVDATAAAGLPAVVVALVSQDYDGDVTDGKLTRDNTTLEVSCIGAVNPTRLYAPSPAVRASEVAALRTIDALSEAVKSALVALYPLIPATPPAGMSDVLAFAIESMGEEEEDTGQRETLIKTVFTVALG